MDILIQQYDWIRRTREVLFCYCETLSPDDYVKELESFGGGSIRNLHVHIADCYRFWLGNFALKKPLARIEPETVKDVQEMRRLFSQTDSLVEEFFHQFRNRWDHPASGTVSWKEGNVDLTPLWLYTHTITHEQHHKGQMVSISRHLGYTPPDTDLVLPF
ncbi:DinB family protein [Paenactinomyces guangxiensis]|uniref:DinB family protein n=1 Tax=Paenactinomyces guangxiensis TaxID=1490290 RepID=A0A7W1WPP0_9BACL|nr:DinB family protein [Paenactinomyces guangxiensis]MBA4493776.1 DinB family protein [Paenactinomyces guangxiensis]MBH8591065.1 DinB family protein [Paenactinomyces guangxiensis]